MEERLRPIAGPSHLNVTVSLGVSCPCASWQRAGARRAKICIIQAPQAVKQGPRGGLNLEGNQMRSFISRGIGDVNENL
jgi:hypothetical protein